MARGARRARGLSSSPEAPESVNADHERQPPYDEGRAADELHSSHRAAQSDADNDANRAQKEDDPRASFVRTACTHRHFSRTALMTKSRASRSILFSAAMVVALCASPSRSSVM